MMVVQRRVKKLHNFWWIVLAVFIGACLVCVLIIVASGMLSVLLS